MSAKHIHIHIGRRRSDRTQDAGKFDESKHKRDAGGRFSTTSGGAAHHTEQHQRLAQSNPDAAGHHKAAAEHLAVAEATGEHHGGQRHRLAQFHATQAAKLEKKESAASEGGEFTAGGLNEHQHEVMGARHAAAAPHEKDPVKRAAHEDAASAHRKTALHLRRAAAGGHLGTTPEQQQAHADQSHEKAKAHAAKAGPIDTSTPRQRPGVPKKETRPDGWQPGDDNKHEPGDVVKTNTGITGKVHSVSGSMVAVAYQTPGGEHRLEDWHHTKVFGQKAAASEGGQFSATTRVGSGPEHHKLLAARHLTEARRTTGQEQEQHRQGAAHHTLAAQTGKPLHVNMANNHSKAMETGQKLIPKEPSPNEQKPASGPAKPPAGTNPPATPAKPAQAPGKWVPGGSAMPRGNSGDPAERAAYLATQRAAQQQAPTSQPGYKQPKPGDGPERSAGLRGGPKRPHLDGPRANAVMDLMEQHAAKGDHRALANVNMLGHHPLVHDYREDLLSHVNARGQAMNEATGRPPASSAKSSSAQTAAETAQRKKYAGGVTETIAGSDFKIHHDGTHYVAGQRAHSTLEGLRSMIQRSEEYNNSRRDQPHAVFTPRPKT